MVFGGSTRGIPKRSARLLRFVNSSSSAAAGVWPEVGWFGATGRGAGTVDVDEIWAAERGVVDEVTFVEVGTVAGKVGLVVADV